MRKVFLDDLPRRGKYIDWKKSVGHKVKFVWNKCIGEVEILSYEYKNHIKIKYNSKEDVLNTLDFRDCRLGKLLGERIKEHRFNIGDILKTAKLKITEKIYTRRKEKAYKYECIICGNLDVILEHDVIKRKRCSTCSNQKTKIGINDIWTINASFGELLWSRNDGYTYSCGSNKRVDFKCPCCGERIKNKVICSIYKNKLSCPRCSDGISYPNKLMYNVLAQAGINFESEYSPSWAVVTQHENEKLVGKKRYDFRSVSLGFIVEMQGGQHYIERKNVNRTLKEEQENDRLKEALNTCHEKNKYIIIKADLSDFEYIKQNILNSELVRIIDFTNFDWEKCKRDSEKSLVKIACDHYSISNKSINDIVKIMKLSNNTIISYLKRGSDIGWCNYDPKEIQRQNGRTTSKNRCKPIVCLPLNGAHIGEYSSAKEVEKTLRIANIGLVCKGKYKSAGGYLWMYKDDYNEKTINNKITLYKNETRGKKNRKTIVRLSLQGDFIDEYPSATEASQQLLIHYSHISSVCSGKRKTAGRFKWMFKEDYEQYIAQAV